MFAKDYLNQVRFKTERIAEQEEYIQRLRDTIGVSAIRYDKEAVQTSPVGDKIAEVICRIIDEEDKLYKMQDELIQFKLTVIDQIRELDNENHKKVLNTVYVDLHNLKECSQIIGFSYAYVKELHTDALKAFKEKFHP